MRRQYDILGMAERILARYVIKAELNAFFLRERAQAAHARGLALIYDRKISADAERALAQLHDRVDPGKLEAFALVKIELGRDEILKFKYVLLFKILGLDMELRPVYVFNSFLRAAGKSTLLSTSR